MIESRGFQCQIFKWKYINLTFKQYTIFEEWEYDFFLILIYNLLSAFGFTSLKDCADKHNH